MAEKAIGACTLRGAMVTPAKARTLLEMAY